MSCEHKLALYTHLAKPLTTVAVTLPVKSASVEPVHSQQKQLKTAVRSTSANDRMSKYSLAHDFATLPENSALSARADFETRIATN